MKPQICYISKTNFKREVVDEERPVLVLCMPVDYDFGDQVEMLKRISHLYGNNIKVGLLEEPFIDKFKHRYDVKGTPTFLILRNGLEQDRSLGLADEQMLLELISPFVEPVAAYSPRL